MARWKVVRPWGPSSRQLVWDKLSTWHDLLSARFRVVSLNCDPGSSDHRSIAIQAQCAKRGHRFGGQSLVTANCTSKTTFRESRQPHSVLDGVPQQSMSCLTERLASAVSVTPLPRMCCCRAKRIKDTCRSEEK